MCLTANNFGLQEEYTNISKPQGKERDGAPQKERERYMDRKREKRGCSAT